MSVRVVGEIIRIQDVLGDVVQQLRGHRHVVPSPVWRAVATARRGDESFVIVGTVTDDISVCEFQLPWLMKRAWANLRAASAL